MTTTDRSDDATAERRRADEESDPEAAVVGVGNRLLRDDGVGPRVIDVLERSLDAPSETVRLYDAGTTGFFALEALSGCDRAIVVDAIRTGKEPGTIREYRFKDGGFDDEVPQVTMHDVSFTEALTFARDVYELPDDVRIIGVEPGSLNTGLELTDPVREAIPEILDRIASYEPAIAPDELSAFDPDDETTVGLDEKSAVQPGEKSAVDPERPRDDTPTPTTHEVRDQ